jgi:hypothetical protein
MLPTSPRASLQLLEGAKIVMNGNAQGAPWHKMAPVKSNSTNSTSPLEKQLTEQFGFQMKVSINKNDAGYSRIPFHDRTHMQVILDKLGLKNV